MPTITLKSTVKSDALRGVPLQLDAIKAQHKKELDKYLRPCKPGEAFEVKREVRRQGNFIMFELAKPIAGEPFWWIYSSHWSLPQHQSAPAMTGTELPKEVRLKVPYFSQRDNLYNPSGACNVTSVAMTLAYYGHPSRNSAGEALDDELYNYCERSGLSRHSPQDLAILITRYGYSDTFRQYATWTQVKEHLIAGNPCIVHSYLCRPFGHIVVIVGFNEKGWIVNDSWGEWCADGYDAHASGEGLTYSYQLMDECCCPDDELWVHFVSR